MPLSYVSADFLRTIAGTEPIRKLKQRAYDLMRVEPGGRILDVGCGPGIDTIPLARRVGPTGRVVGIDHDPGMVAEADAEAARAGVNAWTTHRVADATVLPFESEYFDCCHSERVFVHLPPYKMVQAMAEIVRITKRGGWIVLADVDWATLSIDGAGPDIERRIVRVHLERFHNAYAGRQLYGLLRLIGLDNIAVEGVGVPLSYSTIGCMLAGSEQLALATGLIRLDEWYCWRAALAKAQISGTFFAHVALVLATGQRGSVGRRI
jgi:ubiquinone/menaquinone biosynthesis C-methylase UbiE